jgi:hypothetical protein
MSDETQPFTFAEFDEYLRTHPPFHISLKASNPGRFDQFLRKILSSPPDGPRSDDVVIGVFYLDKEQVRKGQPPFFKQDFIVRHPDGTYAHYTAAHVVAAAASPDVRPIIEFEKKYPEYTRPNDLERPLPHHLAEVSHLPPELQEEGARLLREFRATLAQEGETARS